MAVWLDVLCGGWLSACLFGIYKCVVTSLDGWLKVLCGGWPAVFVWLAGMHKWLTGWLAESDVLSGWPSVCLCTV